MFLIKSQYYQNDNNSSSKNDEVYIDVDDDLVDTPQQAPLNHLLRCDKYFTSPLSQSQINYECTAPIARNTPENNKCKLIDYRNTKLASFCVDSKLLICLPQAFELFLKNLVGGLHTVYTKLKRLDIVPIVCNVEQVRILRGLGAIQPGVNRCKLIAPSEFDTLYDDCTNSGSRPGRPPKRIQTNQHHHHHNHHHESTESSSSDSSEESSTNKKICLDTEGSLSHHHQTVNQLALVYYNNLINYQHQLMQKNEENSCKNLIKDFTVKVNKDDLNLSNSSSSPASSSFSSSSSNTTNTNTLASELILKNKKSNPLSIENLISKKEQDVEDADERRQQQQQDEEEIVDVDEEKLTSNHNFINNNNGSLVFINQQLNQRIDYLTKNILSMESNLKQMKQSLMNERNMRIKYEAKIKNLIKLKRLLIAKTKKSQNLRFLKNSKSKYFRLSKKSMKK